MATEIFRVFGTMVLREEGNIDTRLNSMGRSAGGAGTKFTKLIGILGATGVAVASTSVAIGVGLAGGMALATAKADDFKEALNNLQSDTNSTDKETQALGKTLKNVYKAGYGKDINDTAQAIKTVAQETNTGGKELENYTKKLVTLSDKLGTDYSSTMKTAKVLSSDFGISIDKAFEMMAQGASKGLNSQGDMLDVLSEYSVQFAKNGGSAEDFFNTLIAGNEAGVYSYDKLADMQKEFSLRAIDGSKSTMNAYNELGLSYTEYSNKLAEGGEIGAQAQQTILESLLAVEDPIERNQLGIALMGTQYEDLGDKAVEALASTTEGIDMSKNKMEELNNLRFDGVMEQFDGIKRLIEVDLLLPLGEFLLPIISNVLTTFLDLWDTFNNAPIEEFREKLLNLFPEGFHGWISFAVDMFIKFNEVLHKIQGFIVESVVPALNYLATGEGLEKVSGAGEGTKNILEGLRKKIVQISDYINNTGVPALKYLATGEGLENVETHGTDLKENLENLRKKFVELRDYIQNTVIPTLVYLVTGDGSLDDVKGMSDDTKESIKELRDAIEWFQNKINEVDTADMVKNLDNIISTANGVIDVLKTIKSWVDKLNSLSIQNLAGKAYNAVTGHATGIKNAMSSHFAIVGEQGAELQYIPQGSDIYTADETRNILRNLSKSSYNNASGFSSINTTKGGNVYNINVQIDPSKIDSFQKFLSIFDSLENAVYTM